jgi:hypothetical protein
MTGPASLLAPETEALVAQIGTADILVGLPSYNNAGTIGHVVTAVNVGLAKYFGRRRAVLVTADGASSDGTLDVVARTAVDWGPMLIGDHPDVAARILTTTRGLPGKASALRTILEIARRLQASACAVVDADVSSITPEWVELLVRPILEGGYGYVAPYYLRHKYDGTLTNTIVYPLTRALYGWRLRQPIGGECGVSGDLVPHYLHDDLWAVDLAGSGTDVWMATKAMASGARVCQSFLGAKIKHPSGPEPDVSVILMEVVGAVFALMEVHEEVWVKVKESQPVKLFGFQYEVGVEPVPVMAERMITSFRQGLLDLEQVWRQILSREALEELVSLGAQGSRTFRIADDLWARLVYDAAVAYHRHVMPREHLLKAFTPLYWGYTATYVLETQALTSAEAEGRIEALCQAFEARKPYLIDRWRGEE